jgi:hypothetical protein
MTQPVGPALARVRLSRRLQQMRSERPAADVARAMHWSLSKLNRIENAEVTITPVEVEALARHYGVESKRELNRLTQLSVQSRQRGWWREEREHFEKDFLNFIAFENDAAHLYGYQATFLPPLLQTPQYAEAVTAAGLRQPPDAAKVQEVVSVRMKRQETLRERLAGEHPPSLSLAIDEAVLLRPIGGAAVMAAQLERLAAMAEEPTVRLVVVPLRLGAHPGVNGSFELLTFSEASDLDVVFIETPASDFLLTGADDTSTFRDVMAELLDTDATGDSLASAIGRARTWLEL